MDKRGRIILKGAFIAVVALSILFLAFVFAENSVVLPAAFGFNQTGSNLYNISINNTLPSANVTQVNITLPIEFVYTEGTNQTNSRFVTYNITRIGSTTSTTLSWENTTSLVLADNVTRFFAFNASVATPGTYYINVSVSNSSYTNLTFIIVRINDSIKPIISFTSLTDANNTNLSRANIIVNITATDNYYLENISVSLFNVSDETTVPINMTLNVTALGFLYANFTGLKDGNYTFNATSYDHQWNFNSTETWYVMIDIASPTVNFSGTTQSSNSVVNATFFIVNVTANDTNIRNMTIRIFNSTWSNFSMATPAANVSFIINYTGLGDSIYFYNASAYDYAGNSKTTDTRNITLDVNYPSVDYDTGTLATGTNKSQTFIYVDVIADVNVNATRFELGNTTDVVNSTWFNGTQQLSINWTGLPNGNYTYNVTVFSFGTKQNSTASRTIVLDTVVPSVSMSESSSTGDNIIVLLSGTDERSGVVNGECSLSSSSGSVVGLTVSDLNCGNSYTVTGTCIDYAGNEGTSVQTYTTDICTGSRGSSGGGGTTGRATNATANQTAGSSAGSGSGATGEGTEENASSASQGANAKEGISWDSLGKSTKVSLVAIAMVIVIVAAVMIVIAKRRKSKA